MQTWSTVQSTRIATAFGSPVVVFEDDVNLPAQPPSLTKALFNTFMDQTFRLSMGPPYIFPAANVPPAAKNIDVDDDDDEFALLGYCGDFLCMHAYAVTPRSAATVLGFLDDCGTTATPPRSPKEPFPSEAYDRAVFWPADLHVSLACSKGWLKCVRHPGAPSNQATSKVGCGVHATRGLLHQLDDSVCREERQSSLLAAPDEEWS